MSEQRRWAWRRPGHAQDAGPLCHAEVPPHVRPALDKRRDGACYEARALARLREAGLTLVERNVTLRGGELDLVMRDPAGTLIFVEVRARSSERFGGAAASVDARKQRKFVRAARAYLRSHPDRCGTPCRFDVLAFEGDRPVWLRDVLQPLDP